MSESMLRIRHSVCAFLLPLLAMAASAVEARQAKQESDPSLQHQVSVETVLNKYVEALGGEQRLRNVEAIWIKGTRVVTEEPGRLAFNQPPRNIFKETFAAIGDQWVVTRVGDERTQRIGADGLLVSQDYDGQPTNGLRFDEMFWYRNFFDRSFMPILGWLSDPSRITFAGRKSWKGKAVWQLDFDGDRAGRISRFFDCDSGLLLKANFRTSPKPQTVLYGDYRLVDGIQIPYSITGSNLETGHEFNFETEVVSFVRSSLPDPFEVPDIQKMGDGKVRFQGIVVEKETQKPLAGVAVTIGVEEYCVGFSDADGRFSVTHQPTKAISFVSTGDFQFVTPVSFQRLPLIVTCDEWNVDKPIEIKIELERGKLLQGQVLSSSTREGVSAILDTFTSKANETSEERIGNVRLSTPTARWQRTDPDGRFQMVVPEIDFEIKVRAENLRRYKFEENRNVGWNRVVRIPAERLNGTPLNFELEALSEVFVQAYNSSGTLAEHLHVFGAGPSRRGNTRHGHYGTPRRFYVAADHPKFSSGEVPNSPGGTKGSFAVFGAGLQSNRVLVILDGMKGEGAAVTLDEKNFPTGSINKEVTLQPFGMVTGRLLNLPKDLEHRLKVYAAIGTQGCSYADLSSEGKFELRYVVPNTPISIRFASDQITRDVLITLKPGQKLELGDIDFNELSQLDLTIVDEVTGDPVQGASVKFQSPLRRTDELRTDSDGQLSLGARELSLGPEHAIQSTFEVHPKQGDKDSPHVAGRFIVDCNQSDPGPLKMTVKLPRRRTLTGRVINKKTGEPLQATVTCWPPIQITQKYYLKQLSWSASTNEVGEFTLDVGIDRGQLEVRCQQPRQFQILQEEIVQERNVVNAYANFDIEKTAGGELLLEVVPLRKDVLSVVLPNGTPAKAFNFVGAEPTKIDGRVYLPALQVGEADVRRQRPTYSGNVSVYGLTADSPRLLLALVEEGGKQLGAARMQAGPSNVKEHSSQLKEMRLQPCVSISGVWKGSAKGTVEIQAWLPGSRNEDVAYGSFSFEVDSENRFKIPGLISGLNYRVHLTSSQRLMFLSSARAKKPSRSRSQFVRAMKPGQQVDLGELDFFEVDMLGF